MQNQFLVGLLRVGLLGCLAASAWVLAGLDRSGTAEGEQVVALAEPLPTECIASISDGTAARGHETFLVADRELHPGRPATIRCGVHRVKSLTETIPLAGADVEVCLQAGDKVYPLFQGKTAANGLADVGFHVPRLPPGRYRMVVATRSEWGSDRLEEEIQIRDTLPPAPAAMKEEKTDSPKEPIRISLHAEGGRLTPGMFRGILVRATCANGKPADCKIGITARHGPPMRRTQLRTDRAGLAQFGFVPRLESFRAGDWEQQTIEMFDGQTATFWGPRLTCEFLIEAEDAAGKTDAQGRVVHTVTAVPADARGDRIHLALDHAIYPDGQVPTLEIRAASGMPTVLVDVVHQGQTVAVNQIEVKEGKAIRSLRLPDGVVGFFEVHAYQVLASGEVIRDSRMAYRGNAEKMTEEQFHRMLLGIDRPLPPARWMVAPELDRRRKAEAQVARIGAALFQYALAGREYMTYESAAGAWRFKLNLLEDLVRTHYLDGSSLLDPFGGNLSLDALARLRKDFTVERLAEAQTRSRAQQLAWALINYSNLHATDFHRNGRWRFPENVLADAVKHQELDARLLLDAWGKPFRLLGQDAKRDHSMGCTQFDYDELLSAGPDSRYGTTDDVLPLSMNQWHDFRHWWMSDGAYLAPPFPLPPLNRKAGPGDLLLQKRMEGGDAPVPFNGFLLPMKR